MKWIAFVAVSVIFYCTIQERLFVVVACGMVVSKSKVMIFKHWNNACGSHAWNRPGGSVMTVCLYYCGA